MPLLRCGISLSLRQLLQRGGLRLVCLRLLQAGGFLLLARLPRVSLLRLPEVGGQIDLPGGGGGLCRPNDGGGGRLLKRERGPKSRKIKQGSLDRINKKGKAQEKILTQTL